MKGRVAIRFGIALAPLLATTRAHALPDVEEIPVEEPAYGEASPANAQWIIGVERTAGVAVSTVRDNRVYLDERFYPKQSVDAVGVWGLGGSPGAYAFQAPRLAFDWVTKKTTLGASATVWPASLSRTGGGAIRSLDTRVLVVAFAPRFGWLFCDRARFCFWPKAGITLAYQHAREALVGVDAASSSFSSSGTTQDSLVAIDAEPVLLAGITRHVALGLQGVVSVPVVASRQVSGTSAPTTDPSPWNAGVWLSLHVWY